MSKKTAIHWTEDQYNYYITRRKTKRREKPGVQPTAAETEKKKKLTNSERYARQLFPVLISNSLPLPRSEFHFHPTRKWAFDFAWPDVLLALEVEGGIFEQKWGRPNGGHSSINGTIRDMDKYSEGACLGWRILRVLPRNLTKAATIKRIRAALYYNLNSNKKGA